MKTAVIAALVLALGWASSALCAPALEDYTRDPATEMVALSASGERYAYVGEAAGQRRLFVYSVAGDLIQALPLESKTPVALHWVGDEHLVVTFKATQQVHGYAGNFKVEEVLIDNPLAGKAFWVFSKREGVWHAVFGQFGYARIGGHWTGLFGSQGGWDGFSVQRVDLDTGEEHPISGRALSPKAGTLIFDGHGRLAAYSQYDSQKFAWSAYSRVAVDDGQVEDAQGKLIVSTDKDKLALSLLYGQGRKPGTLIYRIAYPDLSLHFFEADLTMGSPPAELLPGREITGLYYDPETALAVMAIVDGKDDAPEFFAPVLGASFEKARKALAGRRPTLMAWSADFNRLVVLTQGNGDSGTYWLVDIKAGRADILGDVHPAVAEGDVNPIRMFSYKAEDGLALEGPLTLPKGPDPFKHPPAAGFPLVVMPHDGPTSHDVVGFGWMAQALASHGYVVLQPNYRGSDGYGDALRNAGFGEFGRKMQTDISDGARALAALKVVDPKRVCILGIGGYAGYAALAGVTVQHGQYRCAIAVSALAKPGAMSGEWYWSRRWSARTRYWSKYLGLDGSPNASSVLNGLSPLSQAHNDTAPVLVAYGRLDSRIENAQSIQMKEALQASGVPVTTIVLDGEGDTLDREPDRSVLLRSVVSFLAVNNPPN